MKVTNNKIGGNLGNIDTAKAGKSDALGGLKKDNSAGALNKNSSIAGSANVNVSERAQMMQKAKDIASSPVNVDEAKVARLQKLIDEGKYKVDSGALADRLVDEHMSWDE